MEVRELRDWSEFGAVVAEIRDGNSAKRSQRPGYYSPLYFRGQSNATWSLATTLERTPTFGLEVNRYYHTMHASRHEIESHTDRHWEITELEVSRKMCRDYEAMLHSPFPNNDYQYAAYLRHHGFPSP